jgi:N-acetylglucosamine malate deacetylase 1
MAKQKIAIIVAHPDDEVLGCGGAIARHAASADEVHILIMAEGITSRDIRRNIDTRKEELSQLAKASQSAMQTLGAHSVEILKFPDNRMDEVPILDVIKAIETRLDCLQPSIVYTHHWGDLNIDHQITHQAVVTACRPLPEQPVKTIFFFEVLSSTEWQVANPTHAFMPNWFVDISRPSIDGISCLEKKINAIVCYQSEIRPWPHSRSIESVRFLAGMRGAACGISAAEAFVLGRMIQ